MFLTQADMGMCAFSKIIRVPQKKNKKSFKKFNNPQKNSLTNTAAGLAKTSCGRFRLYNVLQYRLQSAEITKKSLIVTYVPTIYLKAQTVLISKQN